MKSSNIGGQAVMEGIMMRNKEKYSVAVRLENQEIVVKEETYEGIVKNPFWTKTPFVRGIFSFIDSLVLGISTLMYSASFFEDEPLDEEATKEQKEAKEKKDKAMMTGTLIFSMILAIGIFVLLPYWISTWFQKLTSSYFLIALLEGILRLVIFIAYVGLISLMPDIKRTYMYHGAEHKCINCIENRLPLTVENVRKSSKEHKRCGTSFILFVVLISILLFMFLRVDNRLLRVLLRLLLIPVIAGISYELLRLTGRTDNAVTNALSKPGLWVQRLTTYEPDDSMIEVGIAAVEAVFDWKTWEEENPLES